MALTREALTQFLEAELGVEAEHLTDDELLFSGGIIDSFALVSLIGFIETTAGIRVRPTEVNVDNMDSIARILAFVGRKTAGS